MRSAAERRGAPAPAAAAARPFARTFTRPLALLFVSPFALLFASGAAGLGVEIVWTGQAAAALGHENAAVLAVVAAFFGGMALGARWLGGRIGRSADPARWYAGCEALVGLWTLVLALLMAPATAALLKLTGVEPSPAWQAAVGLGGMFLLLLPATAAMGATLPAMERALSAWAGPGPRAPVGALYAANTAGAVAGVLAAAFWLVPAFGLQAAAFACAALNLGCAALALRVLPRRVVAPVGAAVQAPAAVSAVPAPAVASVASAAPPPAVVSAAPPLLVASAAPPRGLLLRLFVGGLLGIAYELIAVRVLSQVTESTVFTFALLLAVYLLGTAIGAAAWQRWRRPGVVDALLPAWLALACLACSAALWRADALHAVARGVLGTGLAAGLAAEAACALAALLLPAALMGALFSQWSTQARDGGIGLGHALAANTLGAALAPLLVGALLVPAAGTKATLLLVALGYLLVLPWRRVRSWPVAAAAGIAGLLALGAPALFIIQVPEQGRVVSVREGALAVVSVVADAAGTRSLHIDNHAQEGSSATAFADGRQALLPLLLHAQPRRALFLGLGTGVTATTAALDAGVEVTAVELLPEVIDASAPFRDAVDAQAAARLRVVAADARRFVRAETGHYDVIVADNVHPARRGAAQLTTVQHFGAVRERLADGGVFVQWLPLHQLDRPTLQSIVQAFIAVYPQAGAVLATYSLDTPVLGLVARRDGGRFDAERLRERVARVRDLAAAYALDDELAVLGSFVAGPPGLARLAGDAPPNTDDRPVVAHRAPRAAYVPQPPPRDRLMALLPLLRPLPGEVLAGGLAPQRLAAYWAARDLYLAAGRDVRPSGNAVQMLAQVRAPLLSVLHTSPDFRPAFEPLLRLAVALGRSDAPAARALLAELRAAQPARGDDIDQALRLLAAS